MSRLFTVLCLLGLLAVLTEAHSREKGHNKGRGRGRGGLMQQKCEMTDSEGETHTKGCRDGACTLVIACTDDEGNATKTMKFCDAENDDGTSLVARSACNITDLNGVPLVNRPRHRSHEDDDCSIELVINFKNNTAFAYFPDKLCEVHDRDSSKSSHSSDSSMSSEEDEEERAEGRGLGNARGFGGFGRRGSRRGRSRRQAEEEDQSEESSGESSGEKSERAESKKGGQGRRGGRKQEDPADEERPRNRGRPANARDRGRGRGQEGEEGPAE